MFLAYLEVASLPVVADLAVIATSARVVPSIVAELGARGTRAAVVVSAGFGEVGDAGRELEARLVSVATAHTVRILGPNTVGLLTPSRRLNASFAHLTPPDGPVAFLTQSGAVITSVLDWDMPRDIGFSHLVSLGGMVDIDFADMLDYLTHDQGTDALIKAGGRLASLEPTILDRIDRVLPYTWSHDNPVDLIGDAGEERHRAALEILVEDPGIDVLLVMHAPTAVVSSTMAAQATIEIATRTDVPILTCWIGEATASDSRRQFAASRVPSYASPLEAATAIMQLVDFKRRQVTLMKTPPSIPEGRAGQNVAYSARSASTGSSLAARLAGR